MKLNEKVKMRLANERSVSICETLMKEWKAEEKGNEEMAQWAKSAKISYNNQ